MKHKGGVVNLQKVAKFGWLRPLEELSAVHSGLIKISKLCCPYESFEIHFTNYLFVTEQLPWYGTGVELHHFFLELYEREAIPKPQKYIVLLCKHFCQPDGTQFKPRSLSVMGLRNQSPFVKSFIQTLFRQSGIRSNLETKKVLG